MLVRVPGPLHLENRSVSRPLPVAPRLRTGLGHPALCVLQPPSTLVAPVETIQSTIMRKIQKIRTTFLSWTICKADICGQSAYVSYVVAASGLKCASLWSVQLITSFSKRVRNEPSCPARRQKASSVFPGGRGLRPRLNLELALETPPVGMRTPPLLRAA